jgi:hypothetical protein
MRRQEDFVKLVPTSPLDNAALGVSFAFSAQIPTLAADQAITHLYLHWSATDYFGNFCEYNAIVSRQVSDKVWVCKLQTDPRLNATEPPQPGYAAHTYQRNGHAFGLCVDAMTNATPSNFGIAPITLEEIETLCACAAVVCQKYGIDSADPKLVMTHAEAAILDGYYILDQTLDGVTRWDLARLTASDVPITREEAVENGTLLRARIHEYKLNIMAQKL